MTSVCIRLPLLEVTHAGSDIRGLRSRELHGPLWDRQSAWKLDSEGPRKVDLSGRGRPTLASGVLRDPHPHRIRGGGKGWAELRNKSAPPTRPSPSLHSWSQRPYKESSLLLIQNEFPVSSGQARACVQGPQHGSSGTGNGGSRAKVSLNARPPGSCNHVTAGNSQSPRFHLRHWFAW